MSNLNFGGFYWGLEGLNNLFQFYRFYNDGLVTKARLEVYQPSFADINQTVQLTVLDELDIYHESCKAKGKYLESGNSLSYDVLCMIENQKKWQERGKGSCHKNSIDLKVNYDSSAFGARNYDISLKYKSGLSVRDVLAVIDR